MKLREDNADLGQALDELQADTDARLAAADQQRDELAREHLLALQENQFLRLRMDSIPPCTVWGYLTYPRPQTNPPSRLVLVSDRNGTVFRSEARLQPGAPHRSRRRRHRASASAPCGASRADASVAAAAAAHQPMPWRPNGRRRHSALAATRDVAATRAVARLERLVAERDVDRNAVLLLRRRAPASFQST